VSCVVTAISILMISARAATSQLACACALKQECDEWDGMDGSGADDSRARNDTKQHKHGGNRVAANVSFNEVQK